MNQKLSVLLFSVLFLTAVSAEDPTAVFDMDVDGGARMTISESLELLEIDELNILASAGSGDLMSFSGTIVDDDSASEADFSFSLDARGNDADMSFEMTGSDVSDLLFYLGEFDWDLEIDSTSGTLNIDLTATLDRLTAKELFLLDVDGLQNDTEQARLNLEDSINSLLGILQTGTNPSASPPHHARRCAYPVPASCARRLSPA